MLHVHIIFVINQFFLSGSLKEEICQNGLIRKKKKPGKKLFTYLPTLFYLAGSSETQLFFSGLIDIGNQHILNNQPIHSEFQNEVYFTLQVSGKGKHVNYWQKKHTTHLRYGSEWRKTETAICYISREKLNTARYIRVIKLLMILKQFVANKYQ